MLGELVSLYYTTFLVSVMIGIPVSTESIADKLILVIKQWAPSKSSVISFMNDVKEYDDERINEMVQVLDNTNI